MDIHQVQSDCRNTLDHGEQRLFVKMLDGRVLCNPFAQLHHYVNLLDSEDPDFYFRYYIEPDLFGPQKRAGRTATGGKLALFTVAILLLSAHSILMAPR